MALLWLCARRESHKYRHKERSLCDRQWERRRAVSTDQVWLAITKSRKKKPNGLPGILVDSAAGESETCAIAERRSLPSYPPTSTDCPDCTVRMRNMLLRKKKKMLSMQYTSHWIRTHKHLFRLDFLFFTGPDDTPSLVLRWRYRKEALHPRFLLAR